MTFTALPLRLSLVALLFGGGTIAAAHMAQASRVDAARPDHIVVPPGERPPPPPEVVPGNAGVADAASAAAKPAPSSSAKSPAEAGARDPKSTPSFRYGALDAAACMREVAARGIATTPAKKELAPGVDAPLTLGGPLRGVEVRGVGLASARGGATYLVLDCRLVLALDDLAAQLTRRDVVAIEHFCMHRPRAAKATGKPSQHELGLAIDAASLVKRDGTRLEVKRDWRGRIGAAPCTPVAGEPPAAAGPPAGGRPPSCGRSSARHAARGCSR